MTARSHCKDVVRSLVIAITVVTIGASCGTDSKAGGLAGAVRTPPLVVGSISLPDVGAGDALVTMQAPPNELYLVYFGYTSCPDICPTTLSDIRVAIDDLPAAKADRVTVGMVTVDPERDTPEILIGYLDHFFEHSIALRTDDPAQLASASKAFGVTWQIPSHSPGAAYNVAHTAVTYVIDDTGTVVDEWPFGLTSDAMTSDLSTLLDKEST